jgi:hypothetical protein
MRHGGNYGVVARESNDLVILDSDSSAFEALVDEHLPPTLTVKTGGGKHFYFRCADYSINRDWNTPKGSVRSSGWHAVGPGSTHAETGREYAIYNDRQIATLERSELTFFVGQIEGFEPKDDDVKSVQSGGGATGGGGSAHHSTPDSLDFIRRDDHRRDIAEILTTESEHSRRLWMVGFLYQVCGLRESEIVDLIMSESEWSDLDRKTTEKQVRSVTDAKSRGTHYSEFSPDDGEENGSDSPEGKRNQSDSMSSNNDVDFTDKEAVSLLEGSEPGDSFKKVVRVEIQDGDGGGEYIALKKGRVDEMQTPDGDTVTVENVEDSVSLGSPEYVSDLIEALEELEQKIN